MKKITRLLRCTSVLMLGLLATAQAQTKDSSDWHFAATIYGWFPDIGGHTELPLGGAGDIDVDISTILDHLKLTGQGSFEFRKGRWGAFTDIVYLDVGESKSNTRDLAINGVPIPATVTAAVDFDLKSTFWTLAASYTLFHGPAVSFDVFAGFRDAQLKPSLDWQFAGPLGFFPQSGSTSDTFVVWDGIIGLKGKIRLSQSGTWFIPYYADVGWGSYSSTWQALIGVGYAFDWGDMHLTYRHLHYNTDGNRLIDDLSLSGPALGATFHF